MNLTTSTQKTTALTLLFLILLSVNLTGQNYLINQNFSSTSGTTPPAGWSNNIISGVSGVDNWVFGKHPKFYFAPPFDNNYAIADSYNGGSAGGTATNGVADNVALQSPAINTVGKANLYLSFDYMTLYNGGTGYMEVSTDNGSSWSAFAVYTTVTSVPVSVIYNFSSYIGYTQFRFRFRWDNTVNATYSGYLAVDNVKLFERYASDATITDLAPMYDKSCPSSSQSINVVLKNEGNSTISNIPVLVTVSGAVNTSISATYTGSLSTNSSVSFNVGSINNSNGGLLNFNAVVQYAGDNNLLNDTFRTSRISAAIAGNPTPIDGAACGSGSRVVIGASKNTGDSTFWYEKATGGNIIGTGSPFLTPPVTGTTYFYAQNAQLFLNDQWAFQGPYRFNGIRYSGSYFNISTVNDVLVDSFWQHFAYAGPYTVYVYYKTGTYSGFESNQSAWTLYDTKSVTTTGYGHMVGISLKSPLNIPAGQQYAFYILCDGGTTQKCITFKNATLSYSNADLTISTGTVSSNQFTGISSNYSWDGRVFYRKLCLSNRVAVKATIKPRPIGASITKGSVFEGQFKVGDPSAPDIIEVGKTISYEITPPNGHSNTSHNSSWFITGIVARTKSGQIVPSGEYVVVSPSSSGPGTITFKPKSAYLDSLITFSITFSDLGPNFCDSTIKRSLVVAPTPEPNFKFPASICLGDAVLFDNLTTIHSGNASYMWYFGNGDSSDLQSPVYEYKTPGVYYVTLVAKSFPWNVIKDTTIAVEVGEIPLTKFRVNNKCEGAPVSFQNQTVIGNGTLTYDWDFGDGTPHSTATNPTHQYGTPGGYKVTLTASANGCSSVAVRNAYMFARPVANFVPPLTPVCARTPLALANTSTIALGEQGAYWTFGDGSGSSLFNGIHAYTAPGTYNVKLLAVSEFDCKDSITKQVTIKPTPSPDFSANQFCGKVPTIFTNTTVEDLPNPVYTWTFSDNFTSVLKHVTRTWTSEGPYSATLKASYSNGCEAVTTKAFTVMIQPEADFIVKDICSGESAAFVNKTNGDRGGIEYFWDFGNNTSSTSPAPKALYNPANTTTYTVTLVASYPGACSDTVRKTITVSESPQCGFTYKDMGMRRVKFTPSNTTYDKYEWFFGEGGSSTDVEPVYQYLYIGNFNVKLRTTNIAGCTCEMTSRASATTAIQSFAGDTEISIYPNPSNGTFTVSNTEGRNMHAEIYDVLGNLVYSGQSDGSLLVDISTVSGGIYMIKVNIGDHTTTARIIIGD